jgi:hypothetical protein
MSNILVAEPYVDRSAVFKFINKAVPIPLSPLECYLQSITHICSHEGMFCQALASHAG